MPSTARRLLLRVLLRVLLPFLLPFLLAAGAARAACAMEAPPRAGLLDVAVVDRDTGSTLPLYWSNGQRWVAGVPGHRYAVRVQNRGNGRVLAVVSVDGVNAVSGEDAGWDQAGYVLGSRERYEILGWRKSEAQVADFVFGSQEDSYAARTGRGENIGVIGVAVFRERRLPPVALVGPNERASGEAAASAPAPKAQGAGSLGTSHGAREDSFVALTDFERAQSSPDSLVTIRYDRRERLVAMGIIAEGHGPQAFPGSPAGGFVPDPPALPR